MEKLRISFEPVDSINRQEFRDLIGKIRDDSLLECPKLNSELWIITTSTDTSYINTIAEQYLISTERVIFATELNKTEYIDENKIDISFENNQPMVTSINNETDCFAILVDNIIDYYRMGFKYINKFNQVLTLLENEKKKTC